MIIDVKQLKDYLIVTDAATMVDEQKTELVKETAALCADNSLKLHILGDDYLSLTLLSKATEHEFRKRVMSALNLIHTLKTKQSLGLFHNASTLSQLVSAFEGSNLLLISPVGWEGVEFQALSPDRLRRASVLKSINGNQITIEPLSDLVEHYRSTVRNFQTQRSTAVIGIDKKGDYTDGKGNRIQLNCRIGSGGEGEVFETDWTGVLAKRFYEIKNSMSKILKIAAMSKCNIGLPGLIQPIDLLNLNGKPCGYLMHRVNQAENLYRVLMKTIEKRLDLVTIAMRIVSRVLAAETAGLILDDFGLTNFLINKQNEVFLIDLDSAQYGLCPSEATNKDYWSIRRIKESQNRLITRRETWYSLTVLLYQILHHGIHPMDTLSNHFPDGSNQIDYGRAVFRATKGTTGGEFINHEAASLWYALPDYMQDFFLNVFQTYKLYSPSGLLQLLTRYRNDLQSNKFTDAKMYSAEPWIVRDKLYVLTDAAACMPCGPVAADSGPGQPGKITGWLKRAFCAPPG